MPLDWEKDRRRKARAQSRYLAATGGKTYYDPKVTLLEKDPLFVCEWDDGLIMGVVELDGERLFMRYDRNFDRWTPDIQYWQQQRIAPLWRACKDTILERTTLPEPRK